MPTREKEMQFSEIKKTGCAARESNPGRKNGNLACYHYTSGALLDVLFTLKSDLNSRKLKVKVILRSIFMNFIISLHNPCISINESASINQP